MMNGFENRLEQDLQQPGTGCMGNMINLFEITAGIAKTKLVTEKPHRDVSPNPIQRNQMDVVKKKTMDKFGVPRDGKIINKSCNLCKSLSKKSFETPMKMLIAQEMLRERESRQSPSSVVAKLMGLDALPNDPQFDVKAFAYEGKYRDVYEVEHQNRRHDENPAEKRMTLVHQKFAEAKHLASDEKLLQSKEFQEALEVLCSNRGLFLKFLEGPNSLLSNRFCELQTISPTSEARRITVLKPSKTIEPKGKEKERKHLNSSVEDIDHNMNMNQRSSRRSSFVHHWAQNISQPTRIAVLKPNPTSSEPQESRDFCESLRPGEATVSKEVAKRITQIKKAYTSSNCKDELLSSASSNGYVADESSVSRSKNEYIEEDFRYRVGSPSSVSTLSHRASHSRGLSVIKEAKRRLSERLAMVASIRSSQEESQLRRSTSSLGEMLAIAEVTKYTISSRSLCGNEDSPRNLTRSKYVPVVSSVFENIGLRDEVPDSLTSKSIGSKSKSGLSIFKGKVSSFFSSKSKKAAREKPISPHSVGSDHRFYCEALGEPSSSESFHRCHPSHPEENISVYSEEMSKKISTSSGPKLGSSSLMSCLPFERARARAPENYRDSQAQDQQPRPISVFEDDTNNINISKHPQALSRSPPIGSVSRTLKWQNPRERQVPNSIKLSPQVLSRKCEEQERSLVIHKLLSCANLLDSGDSSTVLARWHSLETPLDPILLNDLSSNQRLLFDCVNAALLSIGQAALVSIYPWPWVKAHRMDGWICPQVAEEVSRLVKDWFSSEKKMFSGEVVDEAVKEEVGGRGWDKSACLEVGELSTQIEGKVLEELVEEALADLTDGCLY